MPNVIKQTNSKKMICINRCLEGVHVSEVSLY